MRAKPIVLTLALAALATAGLTGTANADDHQWTYGGYRCETASWPSPNGGRDGRVTLRSTKDSTKFARITMNNTSAGQDWWVINKTDLLLVRFSGKFFKDRRQHGSEYRRAAEPGESWRGRTTIPKGWTTQLVAATDAGAIGACTLNTART
ncbi:hypothetical protein [Streptomyces alkaliterrae]|uniref:Secreted protein n=1 Tax=Streptomyces alkaliterrae TaxID=2213162 RepID=A0A5P0YVY6_9ACTN|nr:hypothetical protein [Streptomyces alkaliterrae]MBB1252810.1 hypothetical protein [Streptomyces alkaliterrae]MBB1259054.1 hypothetical protein [Streptomyces alkaliterrae]MQS04454.1 hypothetical protein [Streptomyces alkaliterrae]